MDRVKAQELVGWINWVGVQRALTAEQLNETLHLALLGATKWANQLNNELQGVIGQRDELQSRLEIVRDAWVVIGGVYCGRPCPIGKLDESKALTAALASEPKTE